MDQDLERRLRAFGHTLEAETGEAIRPDAGARAVSQRRASRRWWAMAGAAACLVAVVAGLIVANRPADEDVVTAPPSSDVALTTIGIPVTTAPSPLTIPIESVPDDPLALQRDGWMLVERLTDPFEFAEGNLPCADASALSDLGPADQVHDIVVPPDVPELDVDVQIVDVGSLERGNQLADGVQMVGRCLSEQQELEVETRSLSSVRATWFRAGPEFALMTVVGEGNLSVVVEIEGFAFTDFLIADLAHRASQFLGGQPIMGAPDGTPVQTTTIVAQEGPFVAPGPAVGDDQVDLRPGEVQLWVANQSVEDDPVELIIRIDGIPVVSERFAFGAGHDWRSWLVNGLASGGHTVTVEIGTGVLDTFGFTLPEGEPRWLVIDYWYSPDDPEGRHGTLREFDIPATFD